MEKEIHNSRVAETVLRPENIGTLSENITGEIVNPLAGIPKTQLLNDVEAYARSHGLTAILSCLRKGALVAQDPGSYETIEELNEEDKRTLQFVKEHRWKHPKALYPPFLLNYAVEPVQYHSGSAVVEEDSNVRGVEGEKQVEIVIEDAAIKKRKTK